MRIEKENDCVIVINYLDTKTEEERMRATLRLKNFDVPVYIPLRLRVFYDRIEMDVLTERGKLERKMLDYGDFFVLNDALTSIFEKRSPSTETVPMIFERFPRKK